MDDGVDLLGLEDVLDQVRGEQVALDELVVPELADLTAGRAWHAAVSARRSTSTPAASCLVQHTACGRARVCHRATARSSARGSAVR